MSAVETSPDAPWYVQDAADVTASFGTDRDRGLTQVEAARRLAEHGPNSIAAEPSPSIWQVAWAQVIDPMNLMLVAVAVISLFIDQVSVGILVGILVILNVVMGARQELKAKASVDALSKMQIPRARVFRDGTLVQIEASTLVPGDIVALEAGEIVPADGRILRSATLETQEAALTGESAPIPKDAAALSDPETTLGDRANMVFQNTQVTRGTATIVVTDTGMTTQMGRIASMLSAVKPAKSPLQRELDSLTGVLGWIAWGAVAIIVITGLLRGQEITSVVLLGISMAISAIPTGMPSFVQAMLSFGSRQLAEHNAVVKNLTDVETLGATSAINSDKTGTLTMNEMTVESLYLAGEWFTVAGNGYEKVGRYPPRRGHAEPRLHHPRARAHPLQRRHRDRRRRRHRRPDRGRAHRAGREDGRRRRADPRRVPARGGGPVRLRVQVHGDLPRDPAGRRDAAHRPRQGRSGCRPRPLLDGADRRRPCVRSTSKRQAVLDANRSLSEQGLRVLAFAFRRFEPGTAVPADPMAEVKDLTLAGLVGIIDPLRSVVEGGRAHRAGGRHRGPHDHGRPRHHGGGDRLEARTRTGAASGAEIQAMTDDELKAALPNLHVFGRVTPEDKLRLARLMQENGDVVAMTGDAVNDAAALKQADIGVAMGSGSEVTKQAGKMILVDDNFGTLVTAVRLGRAIYDKIVSYVRYQMSQLFSLVLLFLVASLFNINHGVPLQPIMILFLNFFVAIFPVIVILQDPVPDGIMQKPPRDPKKTIANRRSRHPVVRLRRPAVPDDPRPAAAATPTC